MAQYFRYPATGGAAANPSVGTNGITAPTSATEVAGINPSGNLQPLQTDSSGALITTPSPTGTQNENLTEVGGAAISLGQKTSANSLPVVIASDQSAVSISASSLPLPTGASTSALQTSGNTILSGIEANQTNGTQVTTISGNVTVVQPTGSNLHVDVDASALPTGASTSALQTQISGQLPTTLGQKTEAASLAVVIASDQSTIPVSISGTTPVSGTVTANQGTAASLAGAWPVEITDGTNVLGTSSHPVRIDPIGTTTQPVSATSLPLPTGAATAANQTNASQKTQIVDGSGNVIGSTSNALNVQVENFPATQPVSGTVTVTQATGTNLHAVIDSGTVTLSGTSPVSGTVTANQGTANATPWNENIAQFGGTAVSLGSHVSASSIPVVIASDQSAVPVSQSGTWNINNISGTVSLPTGAATAANQTSVIGSATGGTAATSSELVGGLYESTLPTLTTGQQAAIQLDTKGRQLTIQSTPVALTITNAAITVGTTAVRLTVSGSAPASTRVVLVATPDPSSTATFYIGTSTVTNSGSTRGVAIKAGQSFIANNDAGDYWIVASSVSQTVEIMEQA